MAPEKCGNNAHSHFKLTNSQVYAQRADARWANSKYHINWQINGNQFYGVRPTDSPDKPDEWITHWQMQDNQFLDTTN